MSALASAILALGREYVVGGLLRQREGACLGEGDGGFESGHDLAFHGLERRIVEFALFRTKAFELSKDRVIIGRLPESDVTVPDPGVSRRHAEIRRENGGYLVADLGSTNGTMVNEARVSERTLEDGDRITVGGTVLEFRSG